MRKLRTSSGQSWGRAFCTTLSLGIPLQYSPRYPWTSTMRELTLLIDGDIVLFQASAAEEEKYDWQNGTSTVYSDPDRIMRIVRGSINNLVVKLKATGVIVALSDPKKNFRKKILST